MSGDTKTKHTTRSPSLNSATSIWTQQRKHIGNYTTHITRAQRYGFTGKDGESFSGKKISSNLKKHLLDHTAGKAAKEYWSKKTCFRDIDVNLVDWKMIGKVGRSQTISMQQWTSKWTTGFCATGHWMVQMKKRQTADCPRCGHPNENTDHILQCPNTESQAIWDAAIKLMREHLREGDTDPGIIEDLSAGIDAWRKQSDPPPACTPAGQAQKNITWRNLAHGFLSPEWKNQQAAYYNQRNNPASATTWAAELLRLLLKNVRQQWDHRNYVLHKQQPDRVKDIALDTEIRLQYDRGRDALPKTSKNLLDKPLTTTLSLPHHKKQQWITSIKAAHKRQRTALAKTANAQRNLMEQLFRRANHPTQTHE